MAIIQFDCLMPDSDTEALTQRFTQLSHLITRDGKAETAQVTHDANPAVPTEIITQLRAQLHQEHHPPTHVTMYRYVVHLTGATGSLNQVAMLYARLLTPPANLPHNAIAAENESECEIPARYPWTVQIAPSSR